jgi:tetratricopeptide (TPR) repeat protein
MRKAALLFILFISAFNDSLSQKSVADSLESILPLVKDTARVSLLNKIATLTSRTDSKKSLTYSQEALKLAQEIDFKNGIALSHRTVGLAWFFNNDHQQAIENFLLSTDLALANKQWELAIQNYLNLAGIYCSVFGNYVKGLEFYTKALNLCESQTVTHKIYDAYSGIAYVYHHQGENEKALEYYLKALQFIETTNDKNSLGVVYQNMGEHYAAVDSLTEAKLYYEKSL